LEHGPWDNEIVLFDTDSKTQSDTILSPADLPEDVIISPDTRRSNRIPPGQSRTRKWPVLDAFGTPRVDRATWRLTVGGLVGKAREWSLAEFNSLPQSRVFSDFHCVTRWSRLGNLWQGVSTRDLLDAAGGAEAGATHVLIGGADSGWTTNVPIEHFLAEDALLATTHDGEPIPPDHGGPVRVIIPRLYAWKSAKWVISIQLMAGDRPGFWERNGYHMHGDPWTEERYGW
jgi:DMSO/TMAO reductase YedYZ molybdopterin-dependent catalytic subunit